MSDERLPDEGEEQIDDLDFAEDDPDLDAADEETESPEDVSEVEQLRREKAEAEAERDQLRQAMQQPQVSPLVALEQFQQLSYEQQQQLVLHNMAMQRDQADHAYFQKKLAEERLPKRYASQVEQVLQAARQQNMNPTREMVLNAILGHELRTRRSGGARAPATGGQTGRARSQSQQDIEDEKMLRAVTFGEASRRW